MGKILETEFGSIHAECIIEGIPINPKLPSGFFTTPNECRPKAHWAFWRLPFLIIAHQNGINKFHLHYLNDSAKGLQTYRMSFDNFNQALRVATRLLKRPPKSV